MLQLNARTGNDGNEPSFIIKKFDMSDIMGPKNAADEKPSRNWKKDNNFILVEKVDNK